MWFLPPANEVSVHRGVGMPGPRSLLGVGRHTWSQVSYRRGWCAWSQVPSRGWICSGGRGGYTRRGWVYQGVEVGIPEVVGWFLYPPLTLPAWGLRYPPSVLTPSGSHYNTYDWQADYTQPTGMLSCLINFDLWHFQKWTDDFLSWNSTDYPNITYLIVPSDKLWVPDMFLLNL